VHASPLQLVASSPSYLYDARTSLDKLRLTSTRFVSANPPSPTAVFSSTLERQHILVTGGFSSIGKALVRDLLLLGANNGLDDDASTSSSSSLRGKTGGFGGVGSWWGSDEDEDLFDDMQGYSGFKSSTPDSNKRAGIVITLLDSSNKSDELDDMLKHPPLYHRSRVGFNLPVASSGTASDDPFDPDFSGSGASGKNSNSKDGGTPPLEFIDPRSAAFSSSEVSLQSFIQKGRLKIIKGDSRNATLLASILDPPSSMNAEADSQVTEKTKFGFKKRPHHVEDEALALPPVSGIFHLDGYENFDCLFRNSRDCADLERGGVRSLASALGGMDESKRPWIVLGDRGNLDSEKVSVS